MIKRKIIIANQKGQKSQNQKKIKMKIMIVIQKRQKSQSLKMIVIQKRKKN